MADSPLFRRAALEHSDIRRYGSVVLTRPVSHTFLTLLFALFALGVICFLAGFSYTRKAQIPGVLLPTEGVIRIVPQQSGVISTKNVREGQEVKARDVLFVLTSERADVRQGNAEQTISALLQSRRNSLLSDQMQLRRQVTQRSDAATRRIDDLTAAASHLEEQVAAQRRRVSISDMTLKRHIDLQASNFVSVAQVQDKQADLIEQQQRVADLERMVASAKRDRDAAQADLRDLKVQAVRDREASQRSIATVEQDLAENEAKRQIVIRAPHDGIVTAITSEVGQTVTPNQNLASILPSGYQLEAELYAPSRSAGFLKRGMYVLLRYQGYSYQKFGQSRGRVREVSRTAMRPEELSLPGASLPAGATGEPLYRVRVALENQSVMAYGELRPLKSGEILDASVLLDRRRLYEWVLEPLFTIMGRV